MAGQIIPRGERTWLVRLFVGRDPETGKRKYEGHTVHGTKRDAQTYLTSKLRERDLGIHGGVGHVLMGSLLDDLIDDYKMNGKSFAWVEHVVRAHLRPFFGSLKASRIGTDLIKQYIKKRQEPETRACGKTGGHKRTFKAAANGTINRELALLRRSFNLGRCATPPKVGIVPSIPILSEKNSIRKGFFEHGAFLAIRRELPGEIQPIITFAYHTGCRKGEILSLRWEQVDLTERIIRLEPDETKNDEARTIPMGGELFDMLTMQKEHRDQSYPESPWIFSRDGQQILDFRGAWIAACKAAGFASNAGEKKDAPTRLFHDLRRTGVRNLVRAGVPEKVAMMISGHKTRAVFDRYNIVNESDLKDAARRLDEYHASRADPAEEKRHTTGTQSPSMAVH